MLLSFFGSDFWAGADLNNLDVNVSVNARSVACNLIVYSFVYMGGTF